MKTKIFLSVVLGIGAALAVYFATMAMSHAVNLGPAFIVITLMFILVDILLFYAAYLRIWRAD